MSEMELVTTVSHCYSDFLNEKIFRIKAKQKWNDLYILFVAIIKDTDQVLNQGCPLGS